MAEIPEIAANLRLDASGRLDMDISCASCGYNLRGLLPDGRCPECGTAIGRSTRGDYLRFCDPSWVETLASGMNWILANVIVGIVVGGAGGAAAGFTGRPMYALLIGFAGALVGIVGYWRVTAPDPRQPEPDALTLRKAVRYGWPASYVLGFAQQFVFGLGLLYSILVAVPAAIIGLAVQIATFVYAGRMAARIPDSTLVRHTRIVMWGFIVLGVLGCIFAGIVLLYGHSMATAPPLGLAAGGTAGGTTTGGAGTPFSAGPAVFTILGAGCVGGVVYLVFAIWALVLIVRYRRRFHEAARLARSTWAMEPAIPAAEPPRSPTC